MPSHSPDNARPAEADRDKREAQRRLRGRNLAVLAALFAWVVVIYIVAFVRMGGG